MTDGNQKYEDVHMELERLHQRIGELEVTEAQFRGAVEALQESETYLYQILESTPMPTFVIDREHRITHWNLACENLTGLSAEEMIGTADQWRAFYGNQRPIMADMILDNSPAQDVAGYYENNFRRSPLIEDAYEGEIFLPHLGPEGKWVYFMAAPLKDGKGERIGAIETVHDITERKHTEERIVHLNEELENSVAELKRSLEVLKQTQKQLMDSEKMAMLGRLVGGVAHEVNTPIGVSVTAASYLDERTRAALELLKAGALKRSDLESYFKVASESAEMILANLRRASDFIQSFKQVAVDQTSERPRLFHLKTYILDLLASFRPKLKKTSHIVTVDCPDELEIFSFPGAFSQILSNLLVNSIIHGFEAEEKGEIRIEAENREDQLQLTYSDNGKGMNPEQVQHVFEPFFTTRRGKGGDGLGMHIVYNLVTQTLKGEITCSSQPGHGVIFAMNLPLLDKDAQNGQA